MRAKVKEIVEREIDVKWVRIAVPIDGEDQIEENERLREAFVDGSVFEIYVDIDSGQIRNWPKDWPAGEDVDLYLKPRDAGCYELFDADEKSLAAVEDYVPHGVVPGSYGDYVDLQISDEGVITNWPSKREIDLTEEFFPMPDEDD